MAPETAVATEVTFYNWLGRDSKGRAHATCQVIHISGGTRYKTDGGKMVGEPVVEARFANGICTTDNPEIIKELRRLAKDGATSITEDHGLYLSKIMTAEERLNRGLIRDEKATAAAKAETESVKQENTRLRKLLEKQGVKD